MGTAERNRVIVLGASMAGLLAARVLADSYDDVVVVDRDELVDDDLPRKGVPQGDHVHALLTRGRHIIEELLPGITDELISGGAVTGDVTGNVRWVMEGRRMPQPHSDMLLVSMSRQHLEQRVRARVRALPNVSLLHRHDVTGLLTTRDRRTVVGVSVVGDGISRELTGDLVVDATGRRSRTPAWLTELGFPKVAEDRQRIGVGYTTQYFRLPPDRMGADVAIDVVASPETGRGAICTTIEDGRTAVTACGFLGDYPPRDPEGFLTFLKSLSGSDIHDTVKGHEPLGDPVAYRFPANLRRRYERMPSFPAGLLVLGDAVCSFNPVYGQGMTVAALGAMVLRGHVSRPGVPRAEEYFADLAKEAVDSVWSMTTGADLVFPVVEGERTERWRERQAYVGRLLEAATRDHSLLTAYARVVFLVDPPEALGAPEIRAAVQAASPSPSL
ncbi:MULTISPECIES: NAD(P)/FAD-dependent oxidoreductase [unclassified Streptomyces]|uniref:NAD(P)/FAD-dependent oxidoreductase n=1 Tax=unclassified Streptomyces TaxID=2593676 RepID=UPI0019089277|nr:FAD-dependent monooxygenase [Streptomyces sp. HSG2]